MQSAAQTETRKIAGLGGSYKVMRSLTLYLGGMQRRHDVSPQKNTVLALGSVTCETRSHVSPFGLSLSKTDRDAQTKSQASTAPIGSDT